jgi:hypothetical protein
MSAPSITVDPLSFTIATLSLVVSLRVAWLTLLKPGELKMVRPSLIAFASAHGTDGPKVWLRSLLYCTSRRGLVVESLFVRLTRGETRQNFTFWACGERGSVMSGCGLFVGHDGVAQNHHFVLPMDGTSFSFQPGDYTLEVIGHVVNESAPVVLATIRLSLSEAHAKMLRGDGEHVYFDWLPDSNRYTPHVVPKRRALPQLPDEIKNLLGDDPLIVRRDT